MPDLAKVIKGIEHCLMPGIEGCKGCPYYNSDLCFGTDLVMRDALELLKAQEPRVLSLAELLLTESGTPLFIEERGNTVENAFGYNIYMGCHDGYWCDFLDDLWYQREKYGFYWRCWNIKPTEEQRKAVMWDEPQ